MSSVSVHIRSSQLHGDGVYAASDFKEGDVLLRERAAVLLQSLENRRDVLLCASCNRYVGSDDLQVSLLVGDMSREQLVERASDAGLISCRKSCGEFYCSEECLNAHWNHSHCLLCTGNVDEKDYQSSSLIQFKMHSVATNEIFLMVATLYASLCLQIENGVPVDDALAPYEVFVRSPWWDAAVTPKDRDAAVFKGILKDLVTDSWDLLSRTLQLQERGLERRLSADYFSRSIGMFEQNNVGVRLAHPLSHALEAFLRHAPKNGSTDSAQQSGAEKWVKIVKQLVDQAEEGDCDSEHEGPEERDDKEDVSDDERSDDRDTDTGNRNKRALYRDSSDVESMQELIDEGGDSLNRIFPPLDGTAFYFTICKINHSCEPNVIVRYDSSPELGLHAKLCALRPIEKGDELVQSYIEQSRDYFSRQEALRDYGFVCCCRKCAEEKII